MVLILTRLDCTPCTIFLYFGQKNDQVVILGNNSLVSTCVQLDSDVRMLQGKFSYSLWDSDLDVARLLVSVYL